MQKIRVSRYWSAKMFVFERGLCSRRFPRETARKPRLTGKECDSHAAQSSVMNASTEKAEQQKKRNWLSSLSCDPS